MVVHMAERAVRLVISEMDEIGDVPVERSEGAKTTIVKLVEDLREKRRLTVDKNVT